MKEHVSQLALGEPAQQVGGRFAAACIHPHIERAFRLEGQSARWVIQLIRTDSQIGQDYVGCRSFQFIQDLPQVRKAAVHEAHGKALQSLPGKRQHRLVPVDPDEQAVIAEPFRQHSAMTARSESGIDHDLTGTRVC
jgi:hypothetical protein